jgi:hypothetical protein
MSPTLVLITWGLQLQKNINSSSPKKDRKVKKWNRDKCLCLSFWGY